MFCDPWLFGWCLFNVKLTDILMVVASWNNDPYCSPIYLQCLRYWLSLSFPNYYYMKLRIIIYWYTYNNILVYIQQSIVIHKIIYIYIQLLFNLYTFNSLTVLLIIIITTCIHLIHTYTYTFFFGVDCYILYIDIHVDLYPCFPRVF
jgi:hypothetical protein